MTLRILMVEDTETDAKLVLRELQRTGATVESERVETAEAMRAALARPWDVVISDWALPKFSAPLALGILKEEGLDLPFIIVSGTVGEDTTVAAMRAGAHDFVLKEKLGRLLPAVERALRECKERSARREAERALKESEGRFRKLADSGIFGIAVIDGHGNILEANDAYSKMVGYSCEELLAGAVRWPDLTPPEFVHLGTLAAERLQASGVAPPFETETFHKDGSRVPMIVGMAMLEHPKCFAITADLTALKQAEAGLTRVEEALRATEEQLREAEHFRLLVEAVEDYAIFMLDCEGRVATWNFGAERFKGYTPEEILGQHFSIFYPLEDRGEKIQHELEVAAETGRFEVEGWRLRKDGTTFWAKVLITARKDPAGKLLGFAKVTRDLTERRKAKQLEELEARQKSLELEAENHRMHEANRLKSEFLANMSHELRTPLNAIIGFADLMFKGKVGQVSDDHKEYLGDILRSSRHLLKIINDVLDLAKIESGKMEFRHEPVDLLALITEVTDILRGLASSKGIRIETNVDASISEVVLDPSKLKQVLYNYLSNALKFTPDSGFVAIRVLPEVPDAICLEIEDTGIGIRPEDTRRLFVEFQQLDGGMTKKYAGTGLGLALTKRVIEAQGGRVGVRSEPGKGSIFWAVLPRTARAEPEMRALSLNAPPTIAKPVVLIVDDDPASLRLMEAALGALGATAMCFADGAHALRSIETMRPAAVVIDVVMPHIDGFDLLDRMRAVPHLRDVPILVWTVHDLSAAERSRLLRSAQRIILKGEGDAIVDALMPYLGASPPGDAKKR